MLGWAPCRANLVKKLAGRKRTREGSEIEGLKYPQDVGSCPSTSGVGMNTNAREDHAGVCVSEAGRADGGDTAQLRPWSGQNHRTHTRHGINVSTVGLPTLLCSHLSESLIRAVTSGSLGLCLLFTEPEDLTLQHKEDLLCA